jgi:PAS domain S-box-containing protein
MVITRESDLVIYDINDKATSVMGYRREELLGKASTEFTFFVNDEDRQQFFEQYALHGKVESECLWRRKDGKDIYVHIASRQMEIGGEKYFASVIKDISSRKKMEQEKEAARYSLNERMKELTTLYKGSQILQQEKKQVTEVIQELVEILPTGWQYPEITAASITIGDQRFQTKNFTKGVSGQSQWFDVAGNGRGLVEIVYLEDQKQEIEGPFLAEERNLINMIAEMLRAHFAHMHEAEELDKAEANLHATINNTEIFIWSVDRQFNLLSFNLPFAEYMKSQYGIEVQPGSKMFGAPAIKETIELEKKWESYFIRVLAGEKFKFEEHRAGIDFQYSLNPIIEGAHIIGISVFAEDITERKTHDEELAGANKKVAELKLTALRSVMSPHFIFNVLNAIQYYIAKNDRLNAINYLSTFSKLVRSILTHSVSNKITLSDEIEMLKNYINLEMIRFENKFDYNIEVIDHVDIDNIEIPSLLIQPYVENAILHGLYNKNEKGTLSIRIKEDDEAVIFEIEDDGVGREAAMKLRQRNFPSHKSMGVKLTEERLKLINSQNLAAFSIEDLNDAEGPKGTRVTIRISI